MQAPRIFTTTYGADVQVERTSTMSLRSNKLVNHQALADILPLQVPMNEGFRGTPTQRPYPSAAVPSGRAVCNNRSALWLGLVAAMTWILQ